MSIDLDKHKSIITKQGTTRLLRYFQDMI